MTILVSWSVPKPYFFVWLRYLLCSLCYSSAGGSARVDNMAEIGAAIAIVDCIFGIYNANSVALVLCISNIEGGGADPPDK